MIEKFSMPRHRRTLRAFVMLVAGWTGACAGGRAETTFATAAVTRFEPPSLAIPAVGQRTLQILSPDVLELTVITAGPEKPPPDGPIPPAPVPALEPEHFEVTIDGAKTPVREAGFRRRAVYAPLKKRDLRVGNVIALRLAEPIRDHQTVAVTYRGKVAWLTKTAVTAKADPHRLGPAVHVSQVGFAPDSPKQGFVGYYLGTLRELPPPETAKFNVVDLRTGTVAYRGTLKPRADRGMPHGWYRHVAEADFTDLRTPGEYRLIVPGHGASYPFFIDAGIPAAFARTYALGFYHQRCGAENALPFTRFPHAPCHTAPATIPTAPVRTLKGLEETDTDADLFPYMRQGKVDVAGGHHDAGDYSKYTTNSAAMIHVLVFAADNLAGAGALDNLGLPESGDGRSDLLQIAKWEADFLAKMQDEDGGFYFLVYPRDRRYEDDVLPDRGDPQIVWPKNTAATAAATAALAQCASSPRFRELFPDDAKRYLEIARRGWKFLLTAEEQHGRGRTYRKFTHYGDLFGDADEIAWAACELFLATGEAGFERVLLDRFDPRDPQTRHWGWKRLSESYGNAIRSYAFAARSGRVARPKLDRTMLLRCEDEIIACADAWVEAAQNSAYGTSFPEPTKRVVGGGWYFSTDQAFDLAVAAQLDFPEKADQRPAYRAAAYSNLGYDSGANPVNVCFITGLGWKRPLEIVHHYAQNDHRVMPPSGIPLGSIQNGFTWFAVYKGELGAQSYPLDGAKTMPYPILDRWGDTFNLKTEFVVVNLARALAASSWLMAQSPLRDQAWRSARAEISGLPKNVKVGERVTLQLTARDLDLAHARIVWEGRDHPPAFARDFTFTARHAGEQWLEAEAQLPDGRRIFATAKFTATR